MVKREKGKTVNGERRTVNGQQENALITKHPNSNCTITRINNYTS